MSSPRPTLSASATGIHSPNGTLPSLSRIGKVRLAVTNLNESVRFYCEVIGLVVVATSEESRTTALAAAQDGEVLLELQEQQGLKPLHGRKRLGLYHTAFLLPDRAALSNFIHHLNRLGIHYGASDHGASQSLYLTDPDGLELEVYADRDRSSWPRDGAALKFGSKALDFSSLPLVTDERWRGAPDGTRIGHIHFYVNRLQRSATFYHEAMGFDIVNWSIPGAIFISAGGYHHHVGLNTWIAGSPNASSEDARLLFWELVLPDQNEVEVVGRRLKAAASEWDETDKGAPSYTDSNGIRVILKAESP